MVVLFIFMSGVDDFLVPMQCTILAAFPGENEQPQYGATHFFVFFLCAVFLCFRNPPDSDMDYRIFNVRTFLSVYMHTEIVCYQAQITAKLYHCITCSQAQITAKPCAT